jgi:4-amino-4-deoxy-L-arabinose transferase-like glycosyltransferase
MFGSYLYPLLTALAHLAGGVEGSRLVSMVAGALTVVAVAQVAERIGGRTVGLLGGLLAAVTSQHIYISCLGLYDAPAVAGLAVGLAFVVTALRGRGNEQLEGATRNALLLLGGIAAVFAVLMKYVAVVFLPAMFLAVLVWSWGATRRVFWARLLAFGLPVAGGMLIYVVRHWQILLGWWRFTRTYTTLVESNVDRLIEIYFTESLNLVVGLLLAALGLASFRGLPSAPARRDLLLLGAGVLSFGAFHFGTRADVNFAKHVTFTLPFLLPLCALGLRRLLQFAENAFADRGLPRPVALRFSRAAGVLAVVLVGLYQVDKVGGSLQWWPDVRGHTDVARRLVLEGDRALVDDTGAELYLIERGARVDTPFWAAQGATTGVAAARKAVWERAYRTVVLTGGVTREGKALHAAVGPILSTAGYVQVLGFGAAPTSGVWVLPETRPPARFHGPEGL